MICRKKTTGSRKNREDQEAQTTAFVVVFLPPLGFLLALLVNAVIEGVVVGKNVVVVVVVHGVCLTQSIQIYSDGSCGGML